MHSGIRHAEARNSVVTLDYWPASSSLFFLTNSSAEKYPERKQHLVSRRLTGTEACEGVKVEHPGQLARRLKNAKLDIVV